MTLYYMSYQAVWRIHSITMWCICYLPNKPQSPSLSLPSSNIHFPSKENKIQVRTTNAQIKKVPWITTGGTTAILRSSLWRFFDALFPELYSLVVWGNSRKSSHSVGNHPLSRAAHSACTQPWTAASISWNLCIRTITRKIWYLQWEVLEIP